MTVAQAIGDLLLRLGQGSDDNTISDRLALQWIDIERNKLLKAYIDSTGEIPNGSYVTQTCVGVEIEDSDCDDCVRMFFNTPIPVMDLANDVGMNVYRPGGKEVQRLGSEGLSQLWENSPFAPKTGWYRVGSTVYLKGSFPKDIEFRVTVIPSDSGLLNDDDSYPAPDFLMNDILDEAEKVGRRMLLTPQDINNDGKSLKNAEAR